jgi:hypothetical protein
MFASGSRSNTCWQSSRRKKSRQHSENGHAAHGEREGADRRDDDVGDAVCSFCMSGILQRGCDFDGATLHESVPGMDKETLLDE